MSKKGDKLKFKSLTERQWSLRSKSNGNGPRNVRRFKVAGELALLAAIRPGANLKQIHGTLQLLRHWWLSEDYDLVNKSTVCQRLRLLGADLDEVWEGRGDQEPITDMKFHGVSSLHEISGKGRVRPRATGND